MDNEVQIVFGGSFGRSHRVIAKLSLRQLFGIALCLLAIYQKKCGTHREIAAAISWAARVRRALKGPSVLHRNPKIPRQKGKAGLLGDLTVSVDSMRCRRMGNSKLSSFCSIQKFSN